jgi:hypothetical protein
LLLKPPGGRRPPVVPLLRLLDALLPTILEALILKTTLVALGALGAVLLVSATTIILKTTILTPPVLAIALQTPLAPTVVAATRHRHHLHKGAGERRRIREPEERAEGTRAPPHLKSGS